MPQFPRREKTTPTVGAGCARALAFARRYSADEGGVTAVVFGVVFSALFFVMALALDYTSATRYSFRQQAAADAAALAGSQYLGLDNEDEDGEAAAERFFKENLGNRAPSEIDVDLDGESGTVVVTAANNYMTRFMRAIFPAQFRKDEIDVAANSTVVKGDRVEVAMALDNSGSMGGTKIEALRRAATDAVGIIFSGAKKADDVQIGLVPFAASVNVGSGNQGASWIYKGPESALAYPVFTGGGTKSRFNVLTDMRRSWSGCVEARPAPYDVSDALPDTSDVNTFFAPMFAPDEPDDANATKAGYGTSAYSNNYLSDYGGSCPTPEQVCVTWRTRNGVKSCSKYGPEPMPVADAQDRACKYTGATPSTSFEGSATGPNQSCTTPALTPLTSDRALLETRISALIASGNTNVAEGAAWAWRVLSPAAPFTQGRSYDDRSNKKFLIVMTDGDNYLAGASQHNRSVYAAYGYGRQTRISNTTTESAYMMGLNAKTLSVCGNAKEEGVIVYTVAFGTAISTVGLELLEQCASSERHAYIAADETALVNTFQNIAREISKLRVAM